MFRQIKKWLGLSIVRLSDFGGALIAPIERAANAVLRAVLSSTEGADRIGGVFGRLVSGLTWPFRAVGKGLFPKSARKYLLTLGDRRRFLTHRIIDSVMWLIEALNLDRFVQGLLWFLQPLWRPIASVVIFTYAWLETRHWLQMRWGIPAFVMLLLATAVGAYTSLIGNAAVVSKYQLAIKEALEVNDYDLAQLYEKTLAQHGIDTKLAKYNTALSLAGEGQHDEAYTRMQELAPDHEPGYPSAHFWIIQQAMAGEIVDSKEDSRKLAELHLAHLETLNITSPFLQFLQAFLLLQEGELEKAADLLQPLVAVLPNAAYHRLQVNLALKRPEQAKMDARALVTLMTTRTKQDGELTPTDYRWWLAAAEVLGNWDQMHKLLDQWLLLEPDNEAARQTLAIVCHRQSHLLLREPLPDPQQIIEFWLESTELERSNKTLITTVLAVYRNRTQLPVYDQVLKALRESPRTPTKVLLALGTQAAVAKNYGDARLFLEAALDRDASDSTAWNNYGLVLGKGENAELEKAMEAVNRALSLKPGEHRFYETRGQILLRLERWQEAVKDFEFALNGLPDLEAIHLGFATAYSALGEEELAQLHRSRVDE